MSNEPSDQSSSPPPVLGHEPRADLPTRIRIFLTNYFWLIVRNIIGWILILSALPLGMTLPGPGGLPVFLIGFALITFPGKRRLTARVLRGRRMQLEARLYAIVAGFFSILIPAILWWIVAWRYEDRIKHLIATYAPRRSVFYFLTILLIALTWLVTRLSLQAMDLILRSVPRIRRKIRPWLARKGLKLLPPRRRHPDSNDTGAIDEDEILEIDKRHTTRLWRIWTLCKPWLRRVGAVVITATIVLYILRSVQKHWHDPLVRQRVLETSPGKFALAAVMFAIFLCVFRALSWRRILKGFGYKLPYAVATRIWSVSELARYLPGSIMQVVGRALLVAPYGVPASISSTTQILELAAFLMANILVAVPCMLFLGTKNVGPEARPWLFAAMAIVPALAIVLHPKVFYGIGNHILRWLGKPPITKRLRGKKLVGLLAWAVLGLLWQSIAAYILIAGPLGLPIQKWWVVAGAYCLAWIAGFLFVLSPGGIGVREVVFVSAMSFALPPAVRDRLGDPGSRLALLYFLSLLLRLWTIAGELILTAIAVIADHRGVLGLEDAPGRIPPEQIIPEPPPPARTSSPPV